MARLGLLSVCTLPLTQYFSGRREEGGGYCGYAPAALSGFDDVCEAFGDVAKLMICSSIPIRLNALCAALPHLLTPCPLPPAPLPPPHRVWHTLTQVSSASAAVSSFDDVCEAFGDIAKLDNLVARGAGPAAAALLAPPGAPVAFDLSVALR
jgi:hypothetical protein